MINIIFSKADLKYTFRQLAKKPGLALLSIIVLAGGLALSIFTFTALNTIMYKPIPLTNGESIFQICTGPKQYNCGAFNAFEFAQLRKQITSLDNIGIYTEGRVNIESDGLYFSVSGINTQWNMFQLSETKALLGRTLQAYDSEPNAEPVVVLSYDLWQQKFNGSDGVIGSSINILGHPTVIVGVVPQGYQYPWSTELWQPLPALIQNPLEENPVRVKTFALLKENTSETSANLELAGLMSRLRQLYPWDEANGPVYQRYDSAHISTLPAGTFGSFLMLFISIGSHLLTGSIFLLACINVGTLMLARTNERLKDISIRVALGAPRFRLLVQTMAESIIISIIGGVLAILLAGATLELVNLFFSTIGEGALAFWMEFQLDRSTLVGVIIFVGCAILFTSAIPCWRIINGDFNSVMRDGTRGALGLKPGRFSRFLVVISITVITLLLFVGAIVGNELQMIKQNLTSQNPENKVSVYLALDRENYTPAQRIDFFQSLRALLLQDASINTVSVRSNQGSIVVEKEGNRQNITAEEDANFSWAKVSSILGYGSAEFIDKRTVLEGRYLSEFDNDPDSPEIAIISRSLAESLWPVQSAINQRLRLVNPLASDAENARLPWHRVVGVISDDPSPTTVVMERFMGMHKSEVYVPLSQAEARVTLVEVQAKAGSRSGGGTESNNENNVETATVVLGQSIRTLDSRVNFSVTNLEENQAIIDKTLRYGIGLILGTIVFSFLLAIAGIYGLVQNATQLATQEIGTRRALGATDSLIFRTFLYRGSRQVLLGFVFALLLLSPVFYLVSIIVGVDALVSKLPITSTVLIVLYSSILFAVYYPLRKILQMEPSEALRHE